MSGLWPRVAAAVVAMLVGILVLLTMVAMQGLLGIYGRREAADSPKPSPLADYAPTMPPAPRLQTNPWGDIADLRAAEAETLGSYGWVDRDRGVVRIPIERAIELLAERTTPGGTP